jgi:hypothetical protein
MIGPCELCGRETALTRHHLVPQCRHKNKWNKKNFSRQEVKRRLLLLCSACHRQLHALFSEKELERRLCDPDRLRAEPEVRKFVEWIGSKPAGFKPLVNASRVKGSRRARG